MATRQMLAGKLGPSVSGYGAVEEHARIIRRLVTPSTEWPLKKSFVKNRAAAHAAEPSAFISTRATYPAPGSLPEAPRAARLSDLGLAGQVPDCV